MAEMAEMALTGAMVAEVMAEVAALEDPKAREVNEKHSDDHGVNLGKLRALAKRQVRWNWPARPSKIDSSG